MRSTSLGSKAMTAASAKAKANAMIKSQAFKSKGVASLSRRERLGESVFASGRRRRRR
jgi:hypothetical protein